MKIINFIFFILFIFIHLAQAEEKLHKAVYHNDLKRVKLFIEEGYDVNKRNKKGDTVLHIAARMSGVDMMDFLIRNKANPYLKDATGDSLLHIVTYMGSLQKLNFLLDLGLPINVQNASLNTPLHEACLSGHPHLVEALVQRGARLNKKNKKGQASIHLAVQSGFLDVLEALAWEKKLSSQKIKNTTYLKFKNGVLKELQKFKPNKLNINAKDKNGDTALHVALKIRSIEAIEELVKMRANLNIKNKQGDSPLHMLAKNNILDLEEKIEILEKLIENGAKTGIQDKNGDTALHIFIKKSEIHLIKYLISQKANFFIQNAKGLDAFSLIHKKMESDLFLKKEMQDLLKNLHRKPKRQFKQIAKDSFSRFKRTFKK